MSTLVASQGELEICELCDSSPHVIGCPRHEHFDDEQYAYARADSPDDSGPPSFWVMETFAAAAKYEGVDANAAVVEGINEFMRAIQRGELCRGTGRTTGLRG